MKCGVILVLGLSTAFGSDIQFGDDYGSGSGSKSGSGEVRTFPGEIRTFENSPSFQSRPEMNIENVFMNDQYEEFKPLEQSSERHVSEEQQETMEVPRQSLEELYEFSQLQKSPANIPRRNYNVPRYMGAYSVPSSMGTFLGETSRIASTLATDASDAVKAVVDNGLDMKSRMNHFIDADMLSRSWAGRQQAASSTGTMVAGFLRMVGLDEAKLGMMALNVLVYLAEMVAKMLIGDEEPINNEIPQYRSIVQEDGMLAGLELLVTNSIQRTSAIKTVVLDESLPEQMIEGLRNRTGSATSCVQLFVCKMSPLIWGVQESAKETTFEYARSYGFNYRKWWDHAYKHFPAQDKLYSFGRECDAKFPECPLIEFSKFVTNAAEAMSRR